jgi:hypothetical protein
VIWDVTIPQRLGVVPDAHGVPHRVTWDSTSAYAIVETRNGAYLWNMITNTRGLMTTHFNPVSLRSFSELEWRYDLGWVIGRLDICISFCYLDEPVRRAYSLIDGREVKDFSPVQTTNGGQILFTGDHTPGCGILKYDIEKGLVLTGYRGIPYQIVPSNSYINPKYPTYRLLGWSIDCHYFALAAPTVGISYGIYDWETVIFDMTLNRSTVVFEDARWQPHRFSWSRIDGNIAIIETRHGAYLWNVATDERTLITDAANAGMNFYPLFFSEYNPAINWDTPRKRFYVRTVATPNGITAYDAETGSQVAFYSSGGNLSADYFISDDRQNMVVYSTAFDNREGTLTIWNLDSGDSFPLKVNLRSSTLRRSYIDLSPDQHYLVIVYPPYQRPSNFIAIVWDLQLPIATGGDRERSYSLELYKGNCLYPGYFVDSHTMRFYGYPYGCNQNNFVETILFDVSSQAISIREGYSGK